MGRNNDMRESGSGEVDADSAQNAAERENNAIGAGDQKAPRNGSRVRGSLKGKASRSRNTRGKNVADTVTGVQKDPVALADLPLLTSKRWYLTVSAAIGLLVSIISVSYFVIDYVRIKPIEKELEESHALLSSVKADAMNAKAQLEKSEQRSNALAASLDRPSPIFPPDRSSIVGFNISFLWDYGKHDPTTKYILELQDISGRGAPLKFNVDRPETKSMFYAFDRLASGSYLWRVRPGVLVSGQEVAHGPWSPAAVFTINPSVVERIKNTNRVLVATTPTSYDPFVGVNTHGQYDGFELKLLRWLMPRIAEKLQLKQTLDLEIVEVPWNRIFTYMQNGEADIAVRSITRSELREREYQNLRFTTGYVQNHEIFVQLNKEGNYPKSLKGRVVGAKNRSVNEAAAKHLAQKYGFTVNSSFTAYGDLYEGLRRGEISFALVDSSLIRDHLNKSIFALGGFLDNELRDFYRRELGFDHEEYSILVHEGSSDQLRNALNEILGSADYKSFAKNIGESIR